MNEQIKVDLVEDNINLGPHLYVRTSEYLNINDLSNGYDVLSESFDESKLNERLENTNSKLGERWMLFFKGIIDDKDVTFVLGLNQLFSFDIDQETNNGYLSQNLVDKKNATGFLEFQFGDNQQVFGKDISKWNIIDTERNDFPYSGDTEYVILPVQLFFEFWARVGIAPLITHFPLIYIGLDPKSENFNTMMGNFETWANEWANFYSELGFDAFIFEIESENGMKWLKSDQEQYILYTSIIQTIIFVLLIFMGLSLKSIAKNIIKSQENIILKYKSRGYSFDQTYNMYKNEIKLMFIATYLIVSIIYTALSFMLAIEFFTYLLILLINALIAFIIFIFERKDINLALNNILILNNVTGINKSTSKVVDKEKLKISISIFLFVSLISIIFRSIFQNLLSNNIIIIIELISSTLMIVLLFILLSKNADMIIFKNIVIFSKRRWGVNSSWMTRGIFNQDKSLKSSAMLIIGLMVVSLTLFSTINAVNEVTTLREEWQHPVDGAYSFNMVNLGELLQFAEDERVKSVSYTIDSLLELPEASIPIIILGNVQTFKDQTNPSLPYFTLNRDSENAYDSLNEGNVLVGSNVLQKISKSQGDLIIGDYSISSISLDINSGGTSDKKTLSAKIQGAMNYLPLYKHAIDSIIFSASSIDLLNSTYVSKIFFELTEDAKNQKISPDDLIRSISPFYFPVAPENTVSFVPVLQFLIIFLIYILLIMILTIFSWFTVSYNTWMPALEKYIQRGAKIKDIINHLLYTFSILFFILISTSFIISMIISSIINNQISNVLPYPIPIFSKDYLLQITSIVIIIMIIFVVIRKSLLKPYQK